MNGANLSPGYAYVSLLLHRELRLLNIEECHSTSDDMQALSLRLRFAVESETVRTERCELLCECVPSHPFYVKSKGKISLSVCLSLLFLVHSLFVSWTAHHTVFRPHGLKAGGILMELCLSCCHRLHCRRCAQFPSPLHFLLPQQLY